MGQEIIINDFEWVSRENFERITISLLPKRWFKVKKVRELRIEAFNKWPVETQFPIQMRYQELLARENVQSCIVHCNINYVDDKDFHHYIACLLDGLDTLPQRPDRSFESFYIPLEKEMNRIKVASGNNNASRFLIYRDFLSTQDPALISALSEFSALVPLQLCEFAANRILSAQNRILNGENDNNDKMLLNRARDGLGLQFFNGFCAKYTSDSVSDDPNIRAGNQRKAGSLIKKILHGNEVTVDGVSLVADDVNRIGILSTVMLPSMRNDRFHGNAFPSFRSSAYRLKHYAGAQFASTITFLLVLISISCRWQSCLPQAELKSTIEKNSELFARIFESEISK